MRTVVFLLFSLSLLLSFSASADELSREQYRAVVARKVGHEVLLKVGDSSTVVMPIQVEDNSYTIKFAGTFGFEPELLSQTIDSTLSDLRIISPYLVEVMNCLRGDVVYSYIAKGFEVGETPDIKPCGGRPYPEECYNITITFQDTTSEQALKNAIDGKENQALAGTSLIWILLSFVLLIIIIAAFYKSRKSKIEKSDHIIFIGAYQFDKRSMHLTYQGETVELTSKEADLLFVLHSSRNETVERDTILRVVWGDDGDYIGRTLDVFISKLRKKLAGDPSIKIANIRGVGYRLVIDSVAS